MEKIVLDFADRFPRADQARKNRYCGEGHAKLTISKTRSHELDIFLSFSKIITSIDEVRKYVNQSLFVRIDEIEPLPEGQYYFHDSSGWSF